MVYLSELFTYLIITPYRPNLELIKEEAKDFLNFFGDNYEVTEVKKHDGSIFNDAAFVTFSPKLNIVNKFKFSAFANSFYTHKDTPIEYVKTYCLNFLNSNYPELAPFEIERIETKDVQNGITSNNPYLDINEMLITFKPLINSRWD